MPGESRGKDMQKLAGQVVTTLNRSPQVSKARVNTQAFRFRLSIKCLINRAQKSRVLQFNETLNAELSASDIQAFKKHERVMKESEDYANISPLWVDCKVCCKEMRMHNCWNGSETVTGILIKGLDPQWLQLV